MPRAAGKTKGTAADCSSAIDDDDADYNDAGPPSPSRTPPNRRISRNPPKAILAQLKQLDDMEKHTGTQTMIEHARKLGRQRWETFTLRYDEGETRTDPTQPALETYYAESTLSRWDLVADMLQFALMHQEIVDFYGEDYELYWAKSDTTGQIDARMVAFMQDVSRRGDAVFRGRKPRALVVREWQRSGTWETLSASHVVPQEDLAEQREEREGYPLRIW